VTLPVKYSYASMEAQSVGELPIGIQWQYEPKWDGFRCIAFRDGTKVELRSKAGKSLSRYFPEIVAALSELRATKFVLDGELIIPDGKALSFDSLLQRIHPAASRVRKLSAETPAVYVVFDLLVDERGRALVEDPLNDRRAKLEGFADRYFGAARAFMRLSPSTRSLAVARRWLKGRAGLDGVVAKRLDLPYESGDRTGMQKVKRTALWAGSDTPARVMLSDRCCWVCTTPMACSIMLGSSHRLPPKKRSRCCRKWRSSSSRPVSRARSPAVRVDGAQLGRRSGSRWPPSWLSRSRTITFLVIAFGMERASFDGGRTRHRDSAPWSRWSSPLPRCFECYGRLRALARPGRNLREKNHARAE
jgi:hypothetical protein